MFDIFNLFIVILIFVLGFLLIKNRRSRHQIIFVISFLLITVSFIALVLIF
ncbi:hypothetical protein [Methanobrevibacter sp.]